MAHYDLILVGGGIVGLATAYRILETRPSLRLLLLEKEPGLAAHQTGNNSGVIHSGIYYKPGGLKAENCKRGYRQLLDFCDREGIRYEICGKLIVATHQDELPRLESLFERGRQNGLENLEAIGPERIREIEPHCAGIRAIIVPQTGIIDYKAVCEVLGRKIRESGGEIRLGEAVTQIRESNDRVTLITSGGAYDSKWAVTCGGLHSDRLARQTQPDLPLRVIPFRGEYYVVKPQAHRLVKHLIYPVPDPAFPFLGVHFTRLITGEREAGPNAVLAFAREGYRKRDISFRDLAESLAWPGFHKVAKDYWRMGSGEFYRSYWKPAFVRALQRLVPDIRSQDLEPGGAGVRAQACHRDGRLLDDFYILEGRRVIHVCNAPSPAATASLAIGQHIEQLLMARVGSGG